jgi:hypothetical protein
MRAGAEGSASPGVPAGLSTRPLMSAGVACMITSDTAAMEACCCA